MWQVTALYQGEQKIAYAEGPVLLRAIRDCANLIDPTIPDENIVVECHYTGASQSTFRSPLILRSA